MNMVLYRFCEFRKEQVYTILLHLMIAAFMYTINIIYDQGLWIAGFILYSVAVLASIAYVVFQYLRAFSDDFGIEMLGYLSAITPRSTQTVIFLIVHFICAFSAIITTSMALYLKMDLMFIIYLALSFMFIVEPLKLAMRYKDWETIQNAKKNL